MAATASAKPKEKALETVQVEEQPIPVEEQPIPLEERIRQRAYEIYLQRSEGGTPLDDWLQAETEITHTVEQNYVHRDGEAASN